MFQVHLYWTGEKYSITEFMQCHECCYNHVQFFMPWPVELFSPFFPVTRKEMIYTGVLSLKDDWKLSGVVLSKHPRSAETFAHRYTCVSNCYKQKQ